MGIVECTDLESWIVRLVADSVGGRDRITGIRRSRFPQIGSYDCERVTISLRDGSSIALFLKDFARSRLTKDHPWQRRVRELKVYQELLEGSGLGAPRFFGSEWDERRGRYRMLLELVDAEVIEEVDERNGVPAVAWLARMQRHFLNRPEQLSRADFLVAHDRTYFESKARDAERDVCTLASAPGRRLRRVLACYERNIDLMSGQPSCLVHGGYIPWHVLVDRRTTPTRVCAVDWELAARGHNLYDLAVFTDDAAPQLRKELCAAYRDAAQRHGVTTHGSDLEPIVECFRLHRVVDWMSRSVEKEFPPPKIEWLLQRAESLVEAIESHA
jgi:aminoglycoside phosphotransferase (APT) family kinase protein